MTRPPPRVLDLFAVPDDVEPLPGGQGHSVRAGDLVLSPGRDAFTARWLNPVLARLAVRLDEDPARRARDLRIAMPVPARDGSWVVDGWGASRYEPGTVACRDLDVTLAAGRLLHARFASAVPERPAALDERDSRWSRAEALVFGPVDGLLAAEAPDLVAAAAVRFDDTHLGPDQLVHGDLAGNVLLDENGAPVVIDVAPAWRPVRWAEALAVLDGVVDLDAPVSVLDRWTTGADRQALLRAIAFRVLSDLEPSPRYSEVLAALT